MTLHAPVPDHEAARQAMVDGQLRPQGVNDPLVIEAMSLVPREQFVPEDLRPLAYLDRSLPLGHGRFLSSPEAVGLLLTGLAPVSGERALVVGAGTGYSAAVLARIGLDVTAVESSPELAAVARANGIKVVEAPLQAGHARGGPYDLILVDGAIEHLPDALVAQLVEGGRLGAALIEGPITRLAVGRKAGGGLGLRTFADVGAAALPGFNRPHAFTF